MESRSRMKVAPLLVAIAVTLCGVGCLGNIGSPKPTGTLSFINSSTAVDPPPAIVVTADFNGDGILDLAAPSYAGGVVILLGNGDGTFRSAPTISTDGNDTNNAVAADFNGDGKPDLAIVLPYLNEIQVLLGNGDGTFTPGALTSIPSGVGDIATGDFNGDGKPDLVAEGETSTLTILLGNGDGTFTQTENGPTLESEVYGVVVGDLNGDGLSDLAVQSFEGQGSSGYLTVLIANGDGTFRQTQSLAVQNPTSWLALGDLNGDGTPDLVVSSYVLGTCPSQGWISVWLGNGDGTFTPPSGNLAAGICPGPVVVADFNGDGNADVAAWLGTNSIAVFLGNGDGTLSAPSIFSSATGAPVADDVTAAGDMSSDSGALVAADLTNDGLPDLLLPEYNNNSIVVMLAHLTPNAAPAVRDSSK